MPFPIAIPHPTNSHPTTSSNTSSSSSQTKPSAIFSLASSSLDSTTTTSSSSAYDYTSGGGSSSSPTHAARIHQQLPAYTPHRPSPLATANDYSIMDLSIPSTMTTSASAAAVAAAGNDESTVNSGGIPIPSKKKEKGRAYSGSSSSGDYGTSPFAPRRASLMGRELERVEHIVVEVGSPESPRLISCVASSQGFDWNRAIFLPPYLARDEDLEIRQDPVADVTVSDEEARAFLPDW